MSAIKALTQFDFYPRIEQTKGLSLIYFTAHFCSSCQHLSQLLSQLAEKQKDVSVFQVDAQQDQALVAEYEVFHLPAIFLFNNGQYHAQLHCEARIPSILEAINKASALPAEEAP